jgi:N-acetylglucosaminyldiphosphoundecaprenol N-acetyl-beta-D-mannosaminyltransferase
MKINIAGVQVDNVAKLQAIEKIDEFVQSGQPHYIVTPYSEMIVFAQRDEKYKQVLNQANLALPDGIGILWAAKYLSLKLGFMNHESRIMNQVQALGQLKYTLAAIIFNPKYIRSVIKEQVTGSRLIYDIAKLAAEKNYSLALVGGENNVAVQAGAELKKLSPNLRINLALSSQPFDDRMAGEIASNNSDILLIAYSPPKQEIWLAQNYQNLGCKVAIGLGGTFDYLAKKRRMAPNFMHYMGLEWLWRLITQPWRIKRMWNAIPVFIWTVYKYKIKHV